MTTPPARPPLTRRDFAHASAAAGVGALALLGGHARSQPAPPGPDPDLITPETQAAIDRGLASLAAGQSADGSFSDPRNGFGNVAVTGLAGLALLAGGHHPGRGKYGAVVQKAAEYVAGRGNNATSPGYLANASTPSHDGMYQHGFGALFLSEVYGTIPDPARQRRVRDALDKAVARTLRVQNREGGWRYSHDTPVAPADVSVTVAQLMALRAARNAGLAVDKAKVDRCVQYIKDCQLADGGFCYIKEQKFAGAAFARSAAAVVGLFSAGVYSGPEIDRGMRYLMQFLPARRAPFREMSRAEHYFYGHYYAALATWTAGGNYWAEWFPAVRDELLAKAAAAPNRLWADGTGPAYATAVACVILQLPNNYLPIMQK